MFCVPEAGQADRVDITDADCREHHAVVVCIRYVSVSRVGVVRLYKFSAHPQRHTCKIKKSQNIYVSM